VPISLLGAHWIQNQLYAVNSYDPVSLFVAIVVLSAAAVLASFLPARRAASIDPMQALRADLRFPSSVLTYLLLPQSQRVVAVYLA
jgi:hypothetical protein